MDKKRYQEMIEVKADKQFLVQPRERKMSKQK